jgi:uncharacterized protein (TIGR03435 family)
MLARFIVFLIAALAFLGCGDSGSPAPTDIASPDAPASSAFAHIKRQPPGGTWLAPAVNEANFVREFQKTGTLYLVGVPLSRLLAVAYQVHPRDIVLGVSIESTGFDAIAHPRDGKTATARKMLRDRVGEQLGLKVSRQRKQGMAMILGQTRTGERLQPSATREGLLVLGRGELRATGSTISQLVALLRDDSKIPVIDETRLSEHYDYLLEWDPGKGAYAFIQSLGDIGLTLDPAQRKLTSLLVTRAGAEVQVEGR